MALPIRLGMTARRSTRQSLAENSPSRLKFWLNWLCLLTVATTPDLDQGARHQESAGANNSHQKSNRNGSDLLQGRISNRAPPNLFPSPLSFNKIKQCRSRPLRRY